MEEDESKPSDNRRRISENLLEEIESFDGKDFSEQLLKWKNSSDSSSQLDVDDFQALLSDQTDTIIDKLGGY